MSIEYNVRVTQTKTKDKKMNIVNGKFLGFTFYVIRTSYEAKDHSYEATNGVVTLKSRSLEYLKKKVKKFASQK